MPLIKAYISPTMGSATAIDKALPMSFPRVELPILLLIMAAITTPIHSAEKNVSMKTRVTSVPWMTPRPRGSIRATSADDTATTPTV